MKYLNVNKAIFCCIIAICIFLDVNAQEPEIVFEYDAAGNQTKREWICINCTPEQIASISPKKIEALDKSLLAKEPDPASSIRSFKAFPNPVTETLQIEWITDNGSFIRSLEVFSLNGIRMFHGNYTAQQKSASISFLEMIPGGYILRALYSDGKKEALKIIKQ